MDFNIIDIVLGIFLIYGAYQGFNKGLIYQLSSLLGLVLGVYGAINFSGYVADYLTKKNIIDFEYLEDIKEFQYIEMFALFITFIGILIAIHFLGKALESLFSLTGLSIVNTIGGVLFSIMKQLIILSLFMLFILFLNSQIEFIKPSFLEESVLYQTIMIPLINVIKEIIQNIF